MKYLEIREDILFVKNRQQEKEIVRQFNEKTQVQPLKNDKGGFDEKK